MGVQPNLSREEKERMRTKGGYIPDEEPEFFPNQSYFIVKKDKRAEIQGNVELVGYGTTDYYVTPVAGLILEQKYGLDVNAIQRETLDEVVHVGDIREVDFENGRTLLTVIALKSEVGKLYQASIEGKLAEQKLVPIGRRTAELIPVSSLSSRDKEVLTPYDRERLGLPEKTYKPEVKSERHNVYGHNATRMMD